MPESFCLPWEADRLSGWHNVSYRMEPFLLFQGVDFRSKAMMFDFANKWKPIFGMMELYDGFLVLDVVDDEFVHASFDLVMEYLKTRALYIGGRRMIIGL